MVKNVFILLCAVYVFTGCNLEQKSQKQTAAFESISRDWGVQIVGIRRIASGYMLDFRYKVIAPEKAAKILSPGMAAYAIHETTGIKLPVPETKMGPLRQTAQKVAIKPQKNYIILFNNPGGLVKQGEKVTIVIGEFKVEHMTVE